MKRLSIAGEFCHIRLLPPLAGNGLYMALRHHRVGNAWHQCHKKYQAGLKQWLGVCGYCDLFSTLLQRSQAQPSDRHILELTRAIKPVPRFHYNVVPRHNPVTHVCPMGKSLHDVVTERCSMRDEITNLKLGDVTDYYTGHDMAVRSGTIRTVGAFFYDYSGSYFEESSRAGTQEQWDSWLANRVDFRTLDKPETPAEVARHCQLFFDPNAVTKKPGKHQYRCIDDPHEP